MYLFTIKNVMLMKKIFTLIAMALMAIGAQAQVISWTAPIAKGSVAGVYGDTDFKLTVTDTNDKIEIDGNKAYFGDTSSPTTFTHRLKTGGKSDSKNNMSIAIPSAGTLKVYVRTGSNSATDRNLVLTQNETELYNQVVLESSATKVKGLDTENPEKDTNVYPIISVEVVAGTVSVTYPKNSLNFYAFEFVSTSGINTVKAGATENGTTYNLAGQKVDENYKGVVIQNGKKVVVK